MSTYAEKRRSMLEKDEGRRYFVYDDATGERVKAPKGSLTVGIGRNLDSKPLSTKVIEILFEEDVFEAEGAARILFPSWDHISENRRLALLNMIFNLGFGGFANFKRLIEAVNNDNWEQAAAEAEDSRWFQQVGERAERVYKMLLTDSFPY